jgi:uncharacterized membrane protein
VPRLSIEYPLADQDPGGSGRYRKMRLARQAERDTYLSTLHLGWYQVVLIFTMWSVAGLFIEEGWVRLTMGVSQGRPGLVWGPFSPLYGVGAVLLTALSLFLYRREASPVLLFVASMVVGGLLEQVTGWGLETFLGAVSWDYIAGGIWGAISKWVSIPFLLFWGCLGCLWGRVVMPELLYGIGEPTNTIKAAIVALLGLFLAADIVMTLACFDRVVERQQNVPPANMLEQYVDREFNDQFVAERFKNMQIDGVNDHPFER